jgi:hypothetical protein
VDAAARAGSVRGVAAPQRGSALEPPRASAPSVDAPAAPPAEEKPPAALRRAPAPGPAPVAEAPPLTAAPPAPDAGVAQVQPPVPSAAAAAPGGGDAEVQKAERLARIVVSDIVLYNEEKFAAAVTAGNVLEAMEGDMQEGRALFVQRIDPRVRESRDFLAEELLRVARQRGMK